LHCETVSLFRCRERGLFLSENKNMHWLACVVLTILVIDRIQATELPEENLLVPDLIEYWGYPAESHEVQTKDGYLLTLHRIPYGKGHTDTTRKRPVFFLQHGLLCSSSNWVTNQPHLSLGFMLADSGYDVWMGNNRGNTYSKKHVTLPVDSKAFWDFSFQEFAKYDMPAMLGYALNVTGNKQLYYVGHSEGTMMIFAGLSESEKLQKMIKTAFALAPVAHLDKASSPITYLSSFETEIGGFFGFLGVREFMASSYWIRKLADLTCSFDEGALCGNFLFLIAGSDSRNMNATRTPIYFTHTPAGTSVKNMLHFCQLIEAGRFQKYDYGWAKNLYHYHSLKPPQYPIKNIKTEIEFFSGGRDTLADPQDVSWLTTQVKSLTKHHVIPEYNHLDFIWGESARRKVYKKIIKSAYRKDGILRR